MWRKAAGDPYRNTGMWGTKQYELLGEELVVLLGHGYQCIGKSGWKQKLGPDLWACSRIRSTSVFTQDQIKDFKEETNVMPVS